MRVLIYSECFSPNLGDAVIARALEHLVRTVAPESSVRFIDISGRDGYVTLPAGDSQRSVSSLIRGVHRRIYAASYSYAALGNRIRHQVASRFGRQRKLLREALADSDYVLIGGGQLLQDNRLAFPLAISWLVREAKRCGLGVSFFSVGVGERWSASGRRLISGALSAPQVHSIVCRDALSADRICKLVPGISAKVSTTYDAALALPVGGLPRRADSSKIGLCIIHPIAIHRVSRTHALTEPAEMIRFWTHICRALQQQGLDVELFTNGAGEDDGFAKEIAAHIVGDSGLQVPVAPRPRTPDDLLRIVAGFGAVVAHRLHANVIATVLGVPCIALGWDAKLEEFMKCTGQSGRFVQAGAQASEVVERVTEVMRTPATGGLAFDAATKLAADLSGVLACAGGGAA